MMKYIANDDIYELYKIAKNALEKIESRCKKDHSDEPMFEEWKDTIRTFDNLGRGYAERYEKEKSSE
jgi:hypothetical protein